MSGKDLKKGAGAGGIQALSPEELDSVVGGQATGNLPGSACPVCGGMMLDDHYSLQGAKRVRCMQCGIARWYTVS